jgi:hypothetical protein
MKKTHLGLGLEEEMEKVCCYENAVVREKVESHLLPR